MAWLSATPKPDALTKRAKTAEPGEQVSRLDAMKRAKIVPPMPPNRAPHIIARLIEIGITEAAGMGSVPISWREISEWQRNTGVSLSAWEARLLRTLSNEYLAEGRRAESENCPPPWRMEVTRREIDTEAARLRMLLG
ncbi:hypothetical protein [Sphingomonas sp. CFBP 13720]|uniref:hypothetical protein n=1 Tax=Sphingomonas sp. CFBP 13720 TaxID=2775302 RepID=UPI0020180D3C|nr:hypothetical protein [Sphingomonas sp. CFBP 13720]